MMHLLLKVHSVAVCLARCQSSAVKFSASLASEITLVHHKQSASEKHQVFNDCLVPLKKKKELLLFFVQNVRRNHKEQHPLLRTKTLALQLVSLGVVFSLGKRFLAF